jgi:hypothetical protein
MNEDKIALWCEVMQTGALAIVALLATLCLDELRRLRRLIQKIFGER